MNDTTTTIHSLLTPDGELRLTLEEDPIGEVASDDVVVRMEGAPINPSDLGALLGPADLCHPQLRRVRRTARRHRHGPTRSPAVLRLTRRQVAGAGGRGRRNRGACG